MFEKHDQELSYLQELGFLVNPLNKKVDSLEKVWTYNQELEQKRYNLQYEIDGMVVKLNDNNLHTDIGVVGKTPRTWAAIKFAPTEVATKILDITWQVGKTGKVTPVAELEPVLLQGTIVKRATLHNYKEYQELNLKVNDLLIIRKAGDIIPEVVKVIKLDTN
jgi:DNA ligase (NAD+)